MNASEREENQISSAIQIGSAFLAPIVAWFVLGIYFGLSVQQYAACLILATLGGGITALLVAQWASSGNISNVQLVLAIVLTILLPLGVALTWNTSKKGSAPKNEDAREIEREKKPFSSWEQTLLIKGSYKPFTATGGWLQASFKDEKQTPYSTWSLGVILPPNSTQKLTLRRVEGDGELYYVDGFSADYEPKPIEDLEKLHRNGTDEWAHAFQFPSVPFTDTFRNPDDKAPRLYYLQGDGSQKVSVQYPESNQSKMWWLTLDTSESASFTIPTKGFRTIWIAPVYADDYLSRLHISTGKMVAPQGIDLAAARSVATPQQRLALQKLAGQVSVVGFQGTYITVDGAPEPLVHYRVFTPDDAGKKITAGLNLKTGIRPGRPAKILLGLSR